MNATPPILDPDLDLDLPLYDDDGNEIEYPDPVAPATVAPGPPVLEAAIAAHAAGLSVIAIRQDGTKKPAHAWTKNQTVRADLAQISRWFSGDNHGLGIVCGPVSNNLEMFELEGRAVDEGILDQFLAACDDAGLTDLVTRITSGYSERTPSGGPHWLYYCDAVGPNTELASRPCTAAEMAAQDPTPEKDKVKKKVLIETRGRGGFTVCAPTDGRSHPTGRSWVMDAGGFDTIATITAAEREALFAVARTFDRMPPPVERQTTPSPFTNPSPGDDSPLERYDRDNTCDDVFLRNGFAWHSDHAKGTNYTRPGKPTTEGSSATVWSDDGTATMFSSGIDAPTEFVGPRKLRPSQLACALEFGGNFARMAQDLAPARPPTQATAPWGQGTSVALPDDGTPAVSHLPEAVDWVALFSREVTYEWLVEDFWPKGRQLHVFAARKTGKSLVMLWIAANLAAGRDPFTGDPREPIVVMYLDYEMSEEDILERLEDMGFGPDDLGNLRYYLHPPLAPLDTAEGGQGLLALVERDQAEVVVLDTVSRIVEGKENDADTFRAFFRYTGTPLKAAGISMARLDHEGHEAGRSRGSSAKGDDVDVLWRLALADGGYTLTRKAHRIAWVPELIDITTGSEPLSFSRGPRNWPAGTKGIADRLDALGAPLDISRRKASELLKSDGGSAGKNAVIAKALTYRRSGDHPGTTLEIDLGNHSGDHP